MVNKVILVGHAGKDPEVRRLENNLVCARFSLATKERWSKEGNKNEHTEWHNVVVWRGLAEVAEKYVHKGSLLYIEGRLRLRNYTDKEGIKRYAVDVVADVMNILSPKSDVPSSQQPTSVAPPVAPIETITPDDMPF